MLPEAAAACRCKGGWLPKTAISWINPRGNLTAFIARELTDRYCDLVRPVFRFEGLRLNVCAAVILLVDDDPSVRKSLWRLLSVHGYDVHEVSDHTAALEAARGRHPDIMILDLHMPSLSGFEIAREVRADPSLRAICLIAFSASLPDWDEDLNLFDRLVQKPASAELLLDAIADAMGQEARDQSLRSC